MNINLTVLFMLVHPTTHYFIYFVTFCYLQISALIPTDKNFFYGFGRKFKEGKFSLASFWKISRANTITCCNDIIWRNKRATTVLTRSCVKHSMNHDSKFIVDWVFRDNNTSNNPSFWCWTFEMLVFNF